MDHRLNIFTGSFDEQINEIGKALVNTDHSLLVFALPFIMKRFPEKTFENPQNVQKLLLKIKPCSLNLTDVLEIISVIPKIALQNPIILIVLLSHMSHQLDADSCKMLLDSTKCILTPQDIMEISSYVIKSDRDEAIKIMESYRRMQKRLNFTCNNIKHASLSAFIGDNLNCYDVIEIINYVSIEVLHTANNLHIILSRMSGQLTSREFEKIIKNTNGKLTPQDIMEICPYVRKFDTNKANKIMNNYIRQPKKSLRWLHLDALQERSKATVTIVAATKNKEVIKS